MICLDNSEWMRNGDYVPTRAAAQHDAANMVCGQKTQSNPESTVGVLTMAGRNVQVLVSPTDDIGKLLNALHGIDVVGTVNLANALQVAHLALKHRENKKGSQRIIAFVGSPIVTDLKALTKIGKLLKKNNVAVDIVSMGEIEDNNEKLNALIEAVNSNNNSHLVVVPAGVLPSDVLVSSPIIQGEGASGMGSSAAADAGGSGAAGENFSEFGGVDPNMDPELALALRVSMEEERARQEARAGSEGADSSPADAAATGKDSSVPMDTSTSEDAPASAPSAAADTPAPAPAPAQASASTSAEDDEEALMRQALAMSMGGAAAEEDEAMQLALQMSMQADAPASAPAAPEAPAPAPAAPKAPAPAPAPVAAEATKEAATAPAGSAATAAAFLDPGFVNELLAGLPGVNPNDPAIQQAMASIHSAQKDSDKKDGDEEKKDDKK